MTQLRQIPQAWLAAAPACILVIAGPPVAGAAQTVVSYGQVVDASSGQGVPGAIVVGLGADGSATDVVLTDGDGRFVQRFSDGAVASAVRVERIGYAPQRFEAPDYSAAEYSLLRVTSAPIRLDGITASAESLCGTAVVADANVYQVWEEVRKSLVINDLTMSDRVLAFDVETRTQTLDPSSRVVTASATRLRRLAAETPFRAISIDEMTDRGWAEFDENGSGTYYGPNADILLSDAFMGQHCFRVGEAEDRVTLEFEPNRARTGIPEIRGEMRLDGATLELTEIGFEYIGLPRFAQARISPEGEVHFQGAPNGLRVVREWVIRVPQLVTGRFGSRFVSSIREVRGRMLGMRTREDSVSTASTGSDMSDSIEVPADERLVSWEEDGGSEGMLLYLRNRLTMPFVVTSVELWDCENVALSCSEPHPISVRLESGVTALLLAVPVEDPFAPVDFGWTYSVRVDEPVNGSQAQ